MRRLMGQEVKYLAQGLTAEKGQIWEWNIGSLAPESVLGPFHYNDSLLTQQVLSKYFSHYNHSSFEARCLQSAPGLRKDKVGSQTVRS